MQQKLPLPQLLVAAEPRWLYGLMWTFSIHTSPLSIRA
jgi:hypothetical protein